MFRPVFRGENKTLEAARVLAVREAGADWQELLLRRCPKFKKPENQKRRT